MNDPGAKSGEGQERDLSVQNEFFNEARKSRARVAILLNNGKRLTGKIKSFDRFAIILDVGGGAEEMVFKHAIATISHASARPAAGEFRGAPQRVAQPAGTASTARAYERQTETAEKPPSDSNGEPSKS